LKGGITGGPGQHERGGKRRGGNQRIEKKKGENEKGVGKGKKKILIGPGDGKRKQEGGEIHGHKGQGRRNGKGSPKEGTTIKTKKVRIKRGIDSDRGKKADVGGKRKKSPRPQEKNLPGAFIKI